MRFLLIIVCVLSKLSTYIITVYIIITYVPKFNSRIQERYQYLGICMPYSCTKQDVEEMVSQSLQQDDIPERDVKVTKVKSPHDYYHVFRDRIFWLLV